MQQSAQGGTRIRSIKMLALVPEIIGRLDSNMGKALLLVIVAI